MLGPSLTVMHLAIATICTALMIGLGFLPRPGRSTVLWSTMFAIAMVSSIAALTSSALGLPALWLASMALVLCLPFLVWSGLRAQRNARKTYAWLGPVVGAAALMVFVSNVGTPGFPVVGRVTMLFAAVANLLVIRELLRRPERASGVAIPLLLVSVVWVLLGVIGVIAGILGLTDNYELLTQSNAAGLAAYLICALVSLLFFSRGDGAAVPTEDGRAFRVIATDRLQRARSTAEGAWTLLDIRLDDPDDLRGASGDDAFAALSGHFHDVVRASFPAEADIIAFSESRAVVLLARTETDVRTHLHRLRETLAVADPEAPIMLPLSISVGWADATRCGFDIDLLMAGAQAQVEAAIAAGGDRWQRA